MATLRDVWGFPSNSGSGYVANTANWSGDNSFGVDKRVDDFLTGTYQTWPHINPRTDLSTTTQKGSELMARHANDYFSSFGDDANLTFREMYNHEMVEWDMYINGVIVTEMKMVNDPAVQSDRILTRITTSTPHGFSDGDRLSGFAFADTGYEEDDANYKTPYAKVIDSTKFYIYQNSTLTTPAYYPYMEWPDEEHQPLNYWFVRHVESGYDGVVICFPSQGYWDPGDGGGGTNPPPSYLLKPYSTGDTLKIRTQHSGNSLAGTIATATAGTTVYLEKLRDNVYKCFSDSGRTTPFTMTSEVTAPSVFNYTATPSGSPTYSVIGIDVPTGTTGQALHDFLVSHNLNPHRRSTSAQPYEFIGVCRIGLNTGSSSSATKSIPSTLDQSDFFYYKYEPETGTVTTRLGVVRFYEDLNAAQQYFTETLGESGPWYEHFNNPSSGVDYDDYVGFPKGIEIQPDYSQTPAIDYDIQFVEAFQIDGTEAVYGAGMQAYYATSPYSINPGEDMSRSEVGGLYYEKTYPLTVGSQGISGSSTLSGPLMGKYNKLFAHSGVNGDGTSIYVQSSVLPALSDLCVSIKQSPTMYWPGAQKYSYQNSSNATVYAAGAVNFNYKYNRLGVGNTWPQFNDWSNWTVKGQKSSDGSDFAESPNIVPTVNASGYLTNAYTYTEMGVRDFNSLSTNQYYVSQTPVFNDDPAIIQYINNPNDDFWIWGPAQYQQRADEYVAPTPYAEDVWDTDSEWDSSDYVSGQKSWPKHITPRSIKVIQAMPSSTTTSQSGIKYVRSSGIVRHQLEVTYPPMTEADFRTFEATAAAARGQATPFYFYFKDYGNDGNLDLSFIRTDADKTANGPFPVKEDTAIGNKYILLEGFAADTSNVILKGEYMIGNGDADGGLIQAVSSTDSNIYGEAKFRCAVGSRYGYSTGTNIYKNPTFAVVTLSEDTLEYNIGMDQMYTFTVRFDFDEWK